MTKGKVFIKIDLLNNISRASLFLNSTLTAISFRHVAHFVSIPRAKCVNGKCSVTLVRLQKLMCFKKNVHSIYYTE
jgi:hypothetical protein